MAWPEPKYSKNRVKKAGKYHVSSASENDTFESLTGFYDNYQVVENWRASHGAVLNNAQAWLRRLDKSTDPTVGQRLKRYDTIIDKLVSGRSVDLSTMHDIAGVRAIFRNENDLRFFRDKMFNSRALHERAHEADKFDYISRPKETGYRGIHEVFRRKVTAKSGIPWNGLRFEVQLRTASQHAWATAVEIYDSTQKARFKFTKSEDPAYKQFLIISEMFARVHENREGCLENMPDTNLVNGFKELESQTRMVDLIRGLKLVEEHGKLEQNTILQRKVNGSIFIHSFSSFPKAISAVTQIEKQAETVNAVLVGASTPSHIRSAFRNYFDDTSDFVQLLDSALKALSSS